MNKKNTDSISTQPLDPSSANGLLNNVFAACDLAPNSIPVEVLEGWGNYKKSKIRAANVISYIFLTFLVLLPMMFFKPTVTTERTEVDYTSKAVYEVTYIDTEKPTLTRSYSEDGIVYLVVRDPYSGVDFDKITAIGSNKESSFFVVFQKRMTHLRRCVILFLNYMI